MNPSNKSAPVNGYSLTQRYWNWHSAHSGKVTAAHAGLYFYLLHANNKERWANEFKMSASSAMTAIHISSYNTYKKLIKDLVQAGLVNIINNGVNQYAECIISLTRNESEINRNYTIKSESASAKNDTPKSKNDAPKIESNPDALSIASSKNDTPNGSTLIYSNIKQKNTSSLGREDEVKNNNAKTSDDDIESYARIGGELFTRNNFIEKVRSIFDGEKGELCKQQLGFYPIKYLPTFLSKRTKEKIFVHDEDLSRQYSLWATEGNKLDKQNGRDKPLNKEAPANSDGTTMTLQQRADRYSARNNPNLMGGTATRGPLPR